MALIILGKPCSNLDFLLRFASRQNEAELELIEILVLYGV
jgi:hypothetical protein